MHLRAPTVTETEHCAATDCNHTKTYATSSGRPFISNKIFLIIRLIAINQMNGLGLLESATFYLYLDDLKYGPTKRPAAPRRAARRGVWWGRTLHHLKKIKCIVYHCRPGLNCKLRRAVSRREMKAGESLSFTATRFFGVALWPITIARRVTCRKKLSSMHNQHTRKNRLFTRRAASSGPRLLNFAAQHSAARRLVGP